jgi:hypothetical protein
MRRLSVALICCVVLQAMLPTPALAWWEKIEDWSGPGPFYGWTLSGRLVCFTSGTDGITHVTSGGVVFSACRLDGRTRRASIDLGMRFLWADDDPRFANGQRISLTTLEPTFSWRVIESDKWDFFDYGVGAGVYWVNSTEFPSVRGSFLEPVRLDFHATTKMLGADNKRWWLGLPVFRFGLLVFPAGHDTAAFAPSPGTARRISRDWVRSYGIFVDLEPLLNR